MRPRELPRQAARHLAARYRYRRAHARLASLGRSSDPVIVGPWHSEVGFEVLYWIPLLRWLERRYGIDPGRVTAISRGGASPWYADLAASYVDLIDELSIDGVRDLRERQAAEFGCQKQLRPLAEDRELIAAVAERHGLAGARVLHPSEMFWLFRGFWAGLQPLSTVSRHTAYTPLRSEDSPPPEPLPERYIAVKLYHSSCLPDRPETRAKLGDLLEGLAREAPLVLLESDLGIDEHRYYEAGFDGIRPTLSPRDNLAVQSSIVRGADALVTTYGGFSYLGPHLGTATVSVYTDDNFNHEHLDVMQHAVAELESHGETPRFQVGTLGSLLADLAAGDAVGAMAA